MIKIVLTIAALTLAQNVSASTSLLTKKTFAEPVYCSPKNFFSSEDKIEVGELDRARLFKIGKLTLVGAGIGFSNPTNLAILANSRSSIPSSENYCTWYLNNGNEDAEQMFSHFYLPHPYPWTFPSTIASQYEETLGASFSQRPINFVKCATDYNYIALGCNGMRHRGPTAFAMLLAFSGCSPENAAAIANRAWGLNWVPPATRLAAAKKGFEMGNKDPDARQALQKVMMATE